MDDAIELSSDSDIEIKPSNTDLNGMDQVLSNLKCQNQSDSILSSHPYKTLNKSHLPQSHNVHSFEMSLDPVMEVSSRSQPSQSEALRAGPPGTIGSFFKQISTSKTVVNVVEGKTVIDRRSKFIGFAAKVSTVAECRAFKREVLRICPEAGSATHIMVAKRMENDLSGDKDWDSDGEENGGRRLFQDLKVHNLNNVIIAVVRWYGGVMLGPVRFNHISICGISAAKKALGMDNFTSPSEKLTGRELAIFKASQVTAIEYTGGGDNWKKQNKKKSNFLSSLSSASNGTIGQSHEGGYLY